MSNSRGEERRRRSDMPGSQAVRVVFRSRPWSGTARAATPRAGSGSRARPEPDRVGVRVWPAVTFPQPGLAEGPLPLQRGRVKGAPRPLMSPPGSPNPRLAHGPVRCLCVSVRVHQIPRLRVCVCVCVCVCVWVCASSRNPSSACARVVCVWGCVRGPHVASLVRRSSGGAQAGQEPSTRCLAPEQMGTSASLHARMDGGGSSEQAGKMIDTGKVRRCR